MVPGTRQPEANGRSVNYRAQFRFVTLLTIVFLAIGCAKYQTVSPSRFGDAKQGWGEKYRVTMNDGAHFTTTSFTVEDSTLLVREVTKTSSEAVSVPFSVPVSDIKRIELVTVDTKRSVIVAAVVASVVAGALYWLWQSLPY